MLVRGDSMEIAYWLIGVVIVIILIVVIYNIVQWMWSKVDKYELKQRSKDMALNILDKFMSLFDKKGDD